MTDPEASPTAGKAPARPVLQPDQERDVPSSGSPGPEQPAGGPADRPAGAADEDPDTPVDR